MSSKRVFAASGVALEGRALLVEGLPGSGKSTLIAKLIDRGAMLIGDDAVALSIERGRLLASPPPNIDGKLELRNVGIVELPSTSAPVALLLTLTGDAPRFTEEAGARELLDQPIPVLQFDPAIPAAAIRAEWAFRRFGLLA